MNIIAINSKCSLKQLLFCDIFKKNILTVPASLFLSNGRLTCSEAIKQKHITTHLTSCEFKISQPQNSKSNNLDLTQIFSKVSIAACFKTGKGLIPPTQRDTLLQCIKQKQKTTKKVNQKIFETTPAIPKIWILKYQKTLHHCLII